MNVPSEGMLLLVDKPVGWTSFDVVNKLRYALKVKKMGHAGTLDPLATGLLLLGVGKFTKKLNELQGLDKEYTGIIEIGKTTPSYDLETDFDSEKDYSFVNEKMIEEVRQEFEGTLKQIPPAHSAIKVGGKRAYSLARENKKVELKEREVEIRYLNFEKIDLPYITFRVGCTKGTYIRSLAHDIGQALTTGGYLKKLVRTKVGEYSITDALTIDEVIERYKPE